MKKRTVIFDDSNFGHHLFYNYNVMKSLVPEQEVFYYTQLNPEQKEFFDSLGIRIINHDFRKWPNKIMDNVSLSWIMVRIILYSIKVRADFIHFVYFDRFYFSSLFCLPLFLLFFITGGKLILTCHQVPSKKLKLLSLKWLLKWNLVHRVIVHGEFLKNDLSRKVGSCNRITSIDYPSKEPKEYSKEECLSKLCIPNADKPIILYFGGTRFDKGIDILLDSLKHVISEYALVIAGTDDYFSKEFVNMRIQENRIDPDRIFARYQYVEESDVDYYFSLADIVVLPYRRIFSGQSGPLTEGISHNCIVIGPDIGQINQTLNVEGNGITFQVENPEDLAIKIDCCLKNLNAVKQRLKPKQDQYNVKTSIENFQTRSSEIYHMT